MVTGSSSPYIPLYINFIEKKQPNNSLWFFIFAALFPGHRTCLTTCEFKLDSYFCCQKVGRSDQILEHHQMTTVKSYVEISQSQPFHFNCLFSRSLNYASVSVLHDGLCSYDFCFCCITRSEELLP